MKRHILNSEATLIIDNRSSGVRQTVKIQVLSVGNIWISTQQNDLQQLSGGAPVNGTKLSNANSIQDGCYTDFLGQLWARSDVGVDIDVAIFNSPNQDGNVKAKRAQANFPWNAPVWGHH